MSTLPASEITGLAAPPVVRPVGPDIFCVDDVCQVYLVLAPAVVGRPRTAVAIDFGSGRVLDVLDRLGVDAITDVLMTHHHRDLAQDLHRAAAAGIAIHVPPVEQDLFAELDEHWRTRPLANDYNLRQDRFSLLESVPVTGLVPEYRSRTYSRVTLEVVPTPGHTTGSVSYLLERDGRRYGFTGDLIYAPGKVWSLAATQWSYTENEGPAYTVLSCYLLAERGLDRLLPSHGRPVEEPTAALLLLAERMQTYGDSRRTHPWDLRDRLVRPFRRLTQHLLLNNSSNSCSYVLLSDSGAALLVDFGYDMVTGNSIAGGGRAARRPWLASLPALRREFGVSTIDVVLATHHHDDHVAGMNLLREVEGTQVWAPEHVAAVLEEPQRFDLPCRWHDPVPVNRRLALGETFTWREYSVTVHDLPGHTRYAAAYELTVDGVTMQATGDQQQGQGIPGQRPEGLNYQYRNLFRPEDYQASAALYRRVRPGLLLSGHWGARWVDDDYLELLTEAGDALVSIHEQLLPDGVDVGADGVLARIEPYRSRVAVGDTTVLEVSVHNPSARAHPATVSLVLPADWPTAPAAQHVHLGPRATATLVFSVRAGSVAGVRRRVAAEVTIGERLLGQHAEALVDVYAAASAGTGIAREGDPWPR